MTDSKKPQEISDNDLDMRGGEGHVSPVDALRIINDLSVHSKEETAVNPGRTNKNLSRQV